MVADGAAKEAKAQGAGEEDPSMEEILHSIRRIIAEDGEETKDVNTEAAKDKAGVNGAAEAIPPGSDVLELTEMVKEETPPAPPVTVVTKAAPPIEAVKPPASGDVLSQIDAALAAGKPASPPPVATPVTASGDTLLSDQAAHAATSSLKKLKIEEPMPPLVTAPSPSFGSGNTVENMVIQMLRPMVKEWLDNNLPPLVERIVEREVRKLTRQ